MAYFSGEVKKITYSNGVQDFFIVSMDLDSPSLLDSKESALWKEEAFEDITKWVTVKGYFPGLSLGLNSWVAFEADWKKDPKFGLQLAVEKAPSLEALERPESGAGLIKHLGIRFSGPPKQPNWKNELLKNLEDPEGLLKYGVSYDESVRVYHFWNDLRKGFSTLGFLISMGIPKARVQEILSHFGAGLEELVRKDPWSLGKIPGIRFESLDSIAKNLSIEVNCYERVRGAVRQCISASRNSGDLYTTTGGLYASVVRMIGEVDKAFIAQALRDLLIEEEIQIDSTTKPGIKAIYEQGMLHLEEECSRLLVERKKTAIILDEEDHRIRLGNVSGNISDKIKEGIPFKEGCYAAMTEEASRLGFELSPEQVSGIFGALAEPVSIITGLPGTGKTTSLSVLVSILISMEIPLLLIAPTAIAAKRMASLTGHPSYTIHRAFGAQIDRGEGKGGQKEESRYVGIMKRGESSDDRKEMGREWTFGGGKYHPAKLIICDESSMLDQHLLYRVLDCTDPQSRLVFVGDAAQLPSVGPGDVLRNLISSHCFPVTSLVQIFRQKNTSHIVEAAHQIFRGEAPEVQDRHRDFFLVPASSEKKASEIIVKMAQRLFERVQENKREGGEIQTFQVLSPRHRGDAGVTNLNDLLRGVINPDREGKLEAKIGYDVIREGDRIMVVENNYDLDIYNGDIGKISMIDRKNREVKIKIFGEVLPRYLTMTFRDVAKYLRLAYACTVHKYQGLEVGTIVMPILPSFGRQLQRNLLYTAVTRAKKKVILVGKEESLKRAIENNQEDQRNTLFSLRLKNALLKDEGLENG